MVHATTSSRWPAAALAGGLVLLASPAASFDAAESASADAVSGPRVVLELSEPGEIHQVGRRLLSLGAVAIFTQQRELEAATLWRTDGTTGGTYALLDGPWRPSLELGSANSFLQVVGDRAYFTAGESSSDRRALWITDGTLAGTELLADVAAEPSIGFHSPSLGVLFYLIRDFGAGFASIWASDGTPAGTAPMSGFEALPVDIGPTFFAESGGRVYLAFSDPREELQTLWQITPAAGGGFTAAAVRNDLPDAPVALFDTPNGLRFLVGATATEIWRSNGTTAGTTRLVTLPDGNLWGAYGAIDGGIAFQYWTETLGPQLWVSDDTPAGTRPVTALPPPPGGASFDARIADGKVLLFVNDPATRIAHRILVVGDADSEPVELPACSAGAQSCFILAHLLPPQRTAGLRYISVTDEVRGTELLQTDLTPAGTRLVADLCPGPCSSDLVPLAQVGRTLFLVGDDGLSGFEIYALEEGPQPALTRVTDLEPADWPANPIAGVAGSTFLIRSLDPEGGSSLLALDVTDDGAGGCVAGETSLCLGDGRFELTVDWRAFDGRTGVGHARPLTADTGTFWFFDEDNLELIVKVLDASAINGYYWVFYGALSNVEYELTVTDTETGESKRYRNPSGVFASNGDTTALPADAASPPPPLGPQPPSTVRAGTGATTGAACVAGATTLCLGDGRFELTVDWSDFSGGSGVGQAHPLTADTGSFWFFDEDNIELVIKVLDARAVNGRFWVFYGALSNVEYTITVTDTETGGVKTYRNELGSFGSGGDTEAF